MTEWVWLSLVTPPDAEVDEEELDAEAAEAEEEEPEPAEPAVSWTGSDPFGRPCVKRYLTAERAAAAGVDA